ncbi:MAG: hypothetical protein GXP32_00145 [Kiritimatiellaeota bacterium]|nr:hypothetical protein [Kiritimatiellota bacterium]
MSGSDGAERFQVGKLADDNNAKNNVRVWNTSTPGENDVPVLGRGAASSVKWSTEDPGGLPNNKKLYIEGFKTSSLLRNIKFKAEMKLFRGGDAIDITPAIQDELDVTVFNPDIVMQKLNEAKEENPGAFIGFKTDPVRAALRFKPKGTKAELVKLKEGKFTLSKKRLYGSESGGDVKFWKDKLKKHELTKTSWNLADGDKLPKKVFVEGTSVSGQLRDVEIDFESTGVLGKYQDKALATVEKVEIRSNTDNHVTFTDTYGDKWPKQSPFESSQTEREYQLAGKALLIAVNDDYTERQKKGGKWVKDNVAGKNGHRINPKDRSLQNGKLIFPGGGEVDKLEFDFPSKIKLWGKSPAHPNGRKSPKRMLPSSKNSTERTSQ